MNSALNRSSVIRHFVRDNSFEIHYQPAHVETLNLQKGSIYKLFLQKYCHCDVKGEEVDFVTFSESVMIRLHMSCTEKV